ncbi:MAG: flagellar basal body-associated FliL family protein [Neorhizobium sp.]|nr:flagellar basal body-associated FliL family protein [Neorhizobium sp.]
MTDLVTADAAPQKKSSIVVLAAAIGVLTLVGGGGGWFLGKMLAPALQPPAQPAVAGQSPAAAAPAPAAEAAAAPAPEGGHGGAEGAPAASHVVDLKPILTNLAYPSDNWVRLEVSLVFKQAVDDQLAESVHQDILAYLRTVSLQQIQGPRGFQYLRDDLKERIDMRTQGKVADLLFRTFVIR